MEKLSVQYQENVQRMNAILGVNRNCDIVEMACFAPVVNTRGCIFTHKDGFVLRGTVVVGQLQCTHKVMLHPSQLVGGRGSCTDFQVGI